jgi:hypothetical protein
LTENRPRAAGRWTFKQTPLPTRADFVKAKKVMAQGGQSELARFSAASPGPFSSTAGNSLKRARCLPLGTGINKTARAVGLGTGTVHRLKQSMAAP